MTNSNWDAYFICKHLKLQLPQSDATSIASTAICGDEQILGMGVCMTTNNLPPATDCLYCKRSRIMIRTYAYPTRVGSDVVNTIWIGAARFFDKIMNLNFYRFPFWSPGLSIVFETANQLLFFGVDRNYRIGINQPLSNLGINMLKLRIAVRMARSFKGLFVALEAIANIYEKFANMCMADFMSHFTQFNCKGPQALAGPTQRRFGVSTSYRFNQALKVSCQSGIDFNDTFSTGAWSSDTRSCRYRSIRGRFKFFKSGVNSPARDACCLGNSGDASMPKDFCFGSGNEPPETFVKCPVDKLIPLCNFDLFHAQSIT